jgi:hypothetical protein
MMPPTSIDGTDITGATIDGTDVQEITVDGQTVFTAGPTIIDDFEDGNINGWNHITGGGGTAQISNTAFNGSHSLEVTVTTGGPNSTAFFDSFGAKDFTQNFVLSAYVRLGSTNAGLSKGGIGYLYDTTDENEVLGLGLNNETNEFLMVKPGRFDSSGTIRADTSFSPSAGTWYEIELEFDGSDHIGRLYDDSGTLLKTITWSSSSANAENSAYVASIHSPGGSVFHNHFADDFTTDL